VPSSGNRRRVVDRRQQTAWPKDLSDAILLPDAGLFASDVARVLLGVTRRDWCWSAGSTPPTSIPTSRICGTSVRDFCSRVR